VRRNLDYGRRRALRGGAPEAIRFGEAVAMLGLDGLLDRAPGTLSGGERQRVALGRALLSQPKLLLMDEPLVALDRAAKEAILPYFERLHDALDIPVLYVSHDLAEVERLADQVVLMQAGRRVAAGPLAELQARPDLTLARLPDAGVTLGVEVVAHDPRYDLTTLAVGGTTLLAPGRFGPPGSLRRVRIAASDVALVREPPRESSVLNFAPARIVEATPQGAAMLTLVLALGDAGEPRILARITRRSWDLLGLAAGQPVFAQIKGVALVAERRGDF
jgi:molybdate transport system ATP-binding protein